MAPDSPLANRLRKNFRHLCRWARRQELTAFRVYDRDIPQAPYAIDWYAPADAWQVKEPAARAHVLEYPRRLKGDEQARGQGELEAAISETLGVPRERIFLKTHLPKLWGEEQYQRAEASGEPFPVLEQGLKFWVNLEEYLDTGLFLDHRATRAQVRAEARGKRFLNLFAYTGSFSVYAAAGGAEATTTVDLSNTYLDWAQRNLALNGFAGGSHRWVRADASRWVREARSRGERYDLAVLDPPSFSTSKKMAGTFEVQRDHGRLLGDVLALLSPGGALYFSTHFRSFQLDDAAVAGCTVEELTPRSIPQDFRDKTLHRCWRIEVGASSCSPSPRTS